MIPHAKQTPAPHGLVNKQFLEELPGRAELVGSGKHLTTPEQV